MFKIKDKIQIDGDIRVRSLLGLELHDDGQVYCWVDGLIEQINIKHINLVASSDIQQDYAPGDKVRLDGDMLDGEYIIKTVEIGLNMTEMTIHPVYDIIHKSGSMSNNNTCNARRRITHYFREGTDGKRRR